MNILKLAKHLKEFTLDEINIIAEYDCKQELQELLDNNTVSIQNNVFHFNENKKIESFILIKPPKLKHSSKILFSEIASLYLTSKNLKPSTLIGYKSLLKYNILPKFGNMQLKDITYEMILEFMEILKTRYRPKTASNGVTLLGSILKFAFEKGYIKHNPYYGVKNAMCK